MSCLRDFSFIDGSKERISKELVGTSKTTVTFLTSVTTLTAYNGLIPKDDGTLDAVTTSDYTVKRIQVTNNDKIAINSVDVDEEVTLLAVTQNSSYTKLKSKTYPNAYITVNFVIYKNGVEYASTEVSGNLNNRGRNPLGKLTVKTGYTFTEKGNYQVSATITGVYYKSGDSDSQLIEAFFNNNKSRLRYDISVNGEDPVPPTPEDIPEKSNGIDTYSAIFQLSENGTYEITIRGSSKNIASIICDNFKLDSNQWSAADNSDGTVTISFDKDLIAELFPGSYLMKILNAKGDIIAVLDIEIM